jgi:hypothetical protein
MLTETIHIYTCEKCGLKIKDDYEKMIEHEYGHTAPSFQTPVADVYSADVVYPLVITVKMSNGAKVQYSAPCEIEPPTEKESPSETD